MLQKEDRLLRIGVLGAGPIAQAAHFDATRKARNAMLYAICDAASDLLQQVAAMHLPTTSYTDYAAMLDDPYVEAVIIATADQFHVPLARQAIAAGKHVLVEKPLGVTIEECELLAQEVERSGLILQIGHNRRFDPALAFAQHFVREEIGALLAFKGWYYDSHYRYTMTDNLQPIIHASANVRRPTGNPKADRQRYLMLTHGSHLLDITRFLAGEIVQVEARFRERFGSHCWYVAVDFADGTLGHLDLAIPIQGDFEEGFELFGEHGSAKGQIYLPWYHKTGQVECFSAKDRQYHRVLGEDGYTYKRQVEGFAQTILHGVAQHGATVSDGIATMRAMVAIARSVELGRAVRPTEVSGGV